MQTLTQRSLSELAAKAPREVQRKLAEYAVVDRIPDGRQKLECAATLVALMPADNIERGNAIAILRLTGAKKGSTFAALLELGELDAKCVQDFISLHLEVGSFASIAPSTNLRFLKELPAKIAYKTRKELDSARHSSDFRISREHILHSALEVSLNAESEDMRSAVGVLLKGFGSQSVTDVFCSMVAKGQVPVSQTSAFIDILIETISIQAQDNVQQTGQIDDNASQSSQSQQKKQLRNWGEMGDMAILSRAQSIIDSEAIPTFEAFACKYKGICFELKKRGIEDSLAFKQVPKENQNQNSAIQCPPKMNWKEVSDEEVLDAAQGLISHTRLSMDQFTSTYSGIVEQLTIRSIGIEALNFNHSSD